MADDTTLPAPLVSAEVNLTDFGFMPLEVNRLRRSKNWLICKRRPELGFYMINLWTASWHDKPAGSLEDDDDVLADLAMCNPEKWPEVRADVLRGWVKCSDGRLYHPVVAEKVREAWQSKLVQRWKTECARIKKHADRHGIKLPRPEFEEWVASGCRQGHPLPVPKDKTTCPEGQPRETASKGQGEGQGDREGIEGDDARAWSDDDRPTDWLQWGDFFRDERGIDTDPNSVHDRKKLRPLADAWVKAGVTVGQMRRAIETAEDQATESIVYLPAYVDRVLASLSAPIPPPRRAAGGRVVNRQEAIEAENRRVAEQWLAEQEQRNG
jgi:hypothetical protein